jgi:type IV pilus assembly protein PilW
MVGLVIGLIAILVIGQIAAVFEGQKRTSTGGGDAQTNGAAALFLLEREIRMTGYGLMGSTGMRCPLGINIYYNGTTVSNPGASPADGGILAPLRIIDGGTGPDTVVMARSDNAMGVMPTTIVKDMPNSSAEVRVDWGAGLEEGQLFLVGARDGSKICTLMQMSQDPQPVIGGEQFDMQHNSGQFPYNPPNPNNVFTTAPTYGIGDILINIGNFDYQRYTVLCNQLTFVDPSQVAAPYTCTNTQPLVDQIVNLQARYGIAPAGSLTVSQWVDPTGDWASNSLTAAKIARILAVRLAVVARSHQMEKSNVYDCSSGSASLPLWSGGPTMTLTGDQCKYRYKVFETIVPMRNAIWGCGNNGAQCS